MIHLTNGARKFTSLRESIMKYVFLFAAAVCVVSVILICVMLFTSGVPAIFEIGFVKFLFGSRWKPSAEIYGIATMIVGSLYVTAGAIIIGVPLGLFTAIYLEKFSSPMVRRVMKPAITLMAGIPSVVYGFFGLVVIVPFMRVHFDAGKSVLTASVLLGMMILPTIVSVSQSAIAAVPSSYYEGSLALGATHERSVFFVTLGAAKSGILAAIVLGIGRAIGETMAVIMVAGNQAVFPAGITSGVRTMTANIALEMGYAADLHRESLIATAVVLFIFILLINLLLQAVRREK